MRGEGENEEEPPRPTVVGAGAEEGIADGAACGWKNGVGAAEGLNAMALGAGDGVGAG